MRFMLLLHGDDAEFEALDPKALDAVMGEYFAFTDALVKGGKLVAGEELVPARTARSVRRRGDSATITDGPFAETKETIGGFYVIDVADEAEALEWAAKCPAAGHGVVEVRAVVDHG